MGFFRTQWYKVKLPFLAWKQTLKKILGWVVPSPPFFNLSQKTHYTWYMYSKNIYYIYLYVFVYICVWYLYDELNMCYSRKLRDTMVCVNVFVIIFIALIMWLSRAELQVLIEENCTKEA